MRHPAPTSADEILTPEWLTEALSIRYPGAVVSAVNVVQVLGPVATKIRFTVDYAQAPDDAPRALCAKGVLDTNHPNLLTSRTSGRETRFYMEVAPKTTLRVPALHYGGVDPETGLGLIITEDLYASGARFLGALTPSSVEQTRGTVDQLARLHSFSWAGKGLEAYPWITPDLQAVAEKPYIGLVEQQALFDDPRGEHLPRSVLSAERLHAGLRALAKHSADYAPCMCHGDFHAGNLYIDAQGQPGVLDWQMLMQANWALDVAYHFATILTVEDREAAEKDLLRHYLDRLRAYGVEPPSWEEAWMQYRVNMVYGYYQWAVTRFVRPQTIIYEFVRKLGLALVSLESYELLGV
jgi:aminoglycoside/choline kinase family phosphotransferase